MLIALKTLREKKRDKRIEIGGLLWMKTWPSDDEEVESILEEREIKPERVRERRHQRNHKLSC